MIFVARSSASGPQRRRRLGARRDRRGVHRWRGRHRRRRHRHRVDHRWPGDGRPQQRPAADGRRRRRDPDHQGPGPARWPSPSTSTTRRRAGRRSSACSCATVEPTGSDARRGAGADGSLGRSRQLDETARPATADRGSSTAPTYPRPAGTRRRKETCTCVLIAKVVAVTAVAAARPDRLRSRLPTPDRAEASGSTGGCQRRLRRPTPPSASRCPQKTSENWVLAERPVQRRPEGGRLHARRAVRQRSACSEQQNQIQAMVTKRAKVIVIGAIDGAQLGTQVKAAKDAGAIGHRLRPAPQEHRRRRLLRRVRQLQGRPAPGPGPARRHEGQEGRTVPYNIELFAGSPDDANAQVFFDGAMDVLQAEDRRRHARRSPRARPSFNQVVTQGWKAENAQKRMDTLLSANYTSADARRRALPERHPGSGDHHLGQGRRQAHPDRHRSGLRGRVGQVDHGRRAVLDDQQGHPRRWWPRRSRWSQALQKGEDAGDQRHQVSTTTVSRSSRPTC